MPELIAQYGPQVITLLANALLKWGADGAEALKKWLSNPTENEWTTLIKFARETKGLGQTYEQWLGLPPATL